MEILESVEIEGITLNVNFTYNIDDKQFVTIKELFTIEGETFMSYIDNRIPFTYTPTGTDQQVIRGRFIMNAQHFVLLNKNIF